MSAMCMFIGVLSDAYVTCVSQGSLGVSVPNRSLLYVIMGPVGAYFPTGLKPVSLMAEPKYTRAFEGGCGNYKMGSYVFIKMSTFTDTVYHVYTLN